MNTTEHQVPRPPQVDPGLVFVVDDESMIGEVVTLILKRNGFRPRFFQDPELALQALITDEPKPALLLTDYVMSPMNGAELIERCKQHQPGLRTLLYSGNTSDCILDQCSVEPDGYLQKPFLPTTLIGLVRGALEKSFEEGAATSLRGEAGV
jgi:DNA-binding NtrC family response regulator